MAIICGHAQHADSRRGIGIASAPRSTGCLPTRIGVAFGASSTSSTSIFSWPISGRIDRLLVEAAAREAQVRRVGRKLVQRRIDRQPQPALRCPAQPCPPSR